MDNSDVFSSSTAPLTWHDFLERMRHPSAAEFVKAIKSFIVSFLNNAPDAERDSAAVQEFLGNMEVAFRAHSLWAGSSEEELESAGEGLEKYVMTKLFTRVFASIQDDIKADDELHEKMALLQQFIHPENLDIKPTYQNETSWLLAQKELQKINMYKAPRDKLVCILNCCKVISNLLLNASLASKDEHPGADEFLPVLIYVTIKANPPQLHSNLAYIQRFRRETRLVAEAANFFTNMLSVESFISNIDAKAISMDESEYESNMEFARSLLSGLSDKSNNSYNKSDQNSRHNPKLDPMETKPALSSKKHQPSVSSETKSRNDESHGKEKLSPNKTPSISDLENKGATMLLKENEASQFFREFPFLYSQAGDLTVGDIDDLLNNYKQLVLKYVCLARGVGDPASLLADARDRIQEQPEIAKESEKRSESNVNVNTQSQNVKQPKVGEHLQEISDSILGTDTETQNQNLDQPQIGKQLDRINEHILDVNTDTKGQNPDQTEIRKNVSESETELNLGVEGLRNIKSGGSNDSVDISILGSYSTGTVQVEEGTEQTQGEESFKS